jgi:hypothetical protein
MTWPAAFALTLLVEVPVYLAALTLVAGVRPGLAVRSALAVNAVSHPLLWFGLLPVFGALDLSPLAGLLVAEAIVLLGEAVALWAVLRRDAAVLAAAAVVANGLSFLIGVAVQR